jgi:NADH:ubiquinone oxidoreductase subunit D
VGADRPAAGRPSLAQAGALTRARASSSMAPTTRSSVRGQEVHEVGVGPIHASVIEPGHFRFMCLGEQVHHLEIQLGYQHRGVEKPAAAAPAAGADAAGRIHCGDSSIAYAWGYCAAVEALAGVTVGFDAERVRGIALELERIAMHLAALTGLATDIAFLQGGAPTAGCAPPSSTPPCACAAAASAAAGCARGGRALRASRRALRPTCCRRWRVFPRSRPDQRLMLPPRSVRARFQGVGVVSRRPRRTSAWWAWRRGPAGVAFDTRAHAAGRLYERIRCEC